MKNLKNDILGKIKKEKIEPLPRILFFLKNFGFWTLFVSSILVGAIVLSLVFFALFSIDRELFERPFLPFLGMIITTTLLFWLVLFLLLFLAALFGIRHTRRGYKISTKFLLFGNFAASFLLASGFFLLGGSEKMEDFFATRIPIFSHFERQKQMWRHPENGFLGGEIQEIQAESIFLWEDFSKKSWEITTENLPSDFWENPPPFLQKGERIKVIGENISPNSFEAEMILPWKKPPFWRGEMPPQNFERNNSPLRNRE